jgi:hypothetical protein
VFERRKGFPRSDVERVMQHYGVSHEEAAKGLSEGRYPLPPRGTDLEYENYEIEEGVKTAEISGWTRTTLLAIGGFAGVMTVALILHWYKGATGATAYGRS